MRAINENGEKGVLKKKTFIMGILFKNYGNAAGERLEPLAARRVAGGT